jgi:hypothetical protein
MHAVIRTPNFLADAAALSDEEQDYMVTEISKNPLAGAIMKGTGGCRKLRFAGRGKARAAATVRCITSRATTFPSCCWR